MSSRYLKTNRRRFVIPSEGAVFAIEEISIAVDFPPIVVAQAIASGALKTFTLDGIQLVDGTDLCSWVRIADQAIAVARDAA